MTLYLGYPSKEVQKEMTETNLQSLDNFSINITNQVYDDTYDDWRMIESKTDMALLSNSMENDLDYDIRGISEDADAYRIVGLADRLSVDVVDIIGKSVPETEDEMLSVIVKLI